MVCVVHSRYGKSVGEIMKKQEYCKNGHLRSPENILANRTCRTCDNARHRKYYKDNTEQISLRRQEIYNADRSTFLARHFKYNYDLTLNEFYAMNEKQNGVCAICGNPPKKRRLSVDHDHTTKKVRGLLCDVCNRIVLPVAERYSDRYFRAIEYLERRKHDVAVAI